MKSIWLNELRAIGREPKFWIPFLIPPALILIAQLTFQSKDLDLNLFLLIGVLLGTMSISLTADSFAGEKERHTLETLLLTPVPRAQILWAKLLSITPVPILLGCSAQLIMVLPYIRNNHGGDFASISISTLVMGLTHTIFASGFLSFMTLWISLKVETVRSAAQLSLISILPMYFLIQVFGFIILGTQFVFFGLIIGYILASIGFIFASVKAFQKLSF